METLDHIGVKWLYNATEVGGVMEWKTTNVSRPWQMPA